MDMSVVPCHIEEAYTKEIKPYHDSRGHSFEVPEIYGFLTRYEFETYSFAGTFRGFHFQSLPYEQGKIVHLLAGEAFSLLVDLRISSPTFLAVERVVLHPFRWLFVPPGCAHGTYTRVPTRILYKMSLHGYHSDSYHRLRFNDPQLSIHWDQIGGIDHISPQDFRGESLADLALEGLLFP